MGKFLEALCQELAIYTRQLAWLNTAPFKAEGDKSEDPEPTHGERLEEEGITPDFPQVYAFYLIEYLVEIGPCFNIGMGLSVVPQFEIEAWQRNTAIKLSPWEVLTIRRLSAEYRNQTEKSKERLCPAPYSRDEITQDTIDAVDANFRVLLSGFNVKRQ